MQDTFHTCMTQSGPRYAFGGSVGQLILSKMPFENVNVVEFPSYGNETCSLNLSGFRRANIYATIGGLRYAFVHFPHDILLAAGLTDVMPPLPGDLQVALWSLIAFQPALAAELIASEPDIILGDFNSGPHYQPDAVGLLLSAGFVDLTPGTLSTAERPKAR